MPKIIKKNNDPIDLSQVIGLEAFMVPTMRYLHAKERGNENDWMLLAPDALGDNVCMLPSVHYALGMRGAKVSVATKWPDLYNGLALENLIDLNGAELPDEDEFYCIKAYPFCDELSNDFFTSFGTQLVDYISQNLLKQQLPVAHKNIVINSVKVPYCDARVVVHPGASWPSKTFPSKWWNGVIRALVDHGEKPYIVGKSGIVDKAGQAKGTVEVDTSGCVDLRDKLTTLELAHVLQRAKVVLTNDSGPLHIAASGQAWIGMLATVLRPDNITHWRRPDPCIAKNEWGWRMEDLALGGIYQENPIQPNVNGHVYDAASIPQLEKWLPDPKTVADWAIHKLGL